MYKPNAANTYSYTVFSYAKFFSVVRGRTAQDISCQIKLWREIKLFSL